MFFEMSNLSTFSIFRFVPLVKLNDVEYRVTPHSERRRDAAPPTTLPIVLSTTIPKSVFHLRNESSFISVYSFLLCPSPSFPSPFPRPPCPTFLFAANQDATHAPSRRFLPGSRF